MRPPFSPVSCGQGLKQADDFLGEFVVVDFAVTREYMVIEIIFLIRYNFVVCSDSDIQLIDIA